MTEKNPPTGRSRWFRQLAGLVVSIFVCLGAGGLGAIATTPEIKGWYATIEKPSWNPPDAVFGPVWTTLYLLMAIAAWLVGRSAGFRQTAAPLALFGVQLVLNVAWSWIFFGLHQPGWAFAEILFLWIAIALTTIAFFRSSRIAGWLMTPYLAWVTFASVLNFAIWQLN
ncbi:TspO/MBR family protein [Lignipirellula cremea]|uniref:TspO/MBR family protein n=1 Tax=Lignipirellula cremea TaxID=2528010 RepID=A0A518DWD3_9BACT|nr:TspO/MBR family protein [Lignipirellula cremea]QDU96150.1 TspO/MBR family protein [Lignipirellula cremea]